ncbi:ISAzo13-like element transposase-related protein [Candidatus Magnetominusculus xianensis]|uniref:Transposase n=1 Tax=Candidatus Magnetominusculus xianensis TaxID=1748249 RepID=A0ABR5SCA7_9BACT|nr:hypothetical protein [Candidatus Magnetominusculus xianensis]KWT79619.1 transposase [Candidatus Magnetominusculus xianensis]MBF0403832.1 hypothetical protein [Nitrospirota bacterium]
MLSWIPAFAGETTIRLGKRELGKKQETLKETETASRIRKRVGGRPLINHEVIVNLIANTTTTAGFRIHAELDTSQYPTGLKISKEQTMKVKIEPATFHENDWNYTIYPNLIQNR